jgi:hypothetical protein
VEYSELKHFGELYYPKNSPKIWTTFLTTMPKELGVLGTPKFMTKMGSQDRYWKEDFHFKTVEERGIAHQEFLDGARFSIACYTTLLAVTDKQKAMEIYPTLADKMWVLQWEEFLPSAKEFRRFPDPWEAFREYFHEFFRAHQREGVKRYNIIENTDTEFHVQLTDCAWDAMFREAGHPEPQCMHGQAEGTCLARLSAKMGFHFKRESSLCCGDTTCDWHFYSRKVSG